MTAIASLDSLVQKLTGGDNGNPENLHWFKAAKVAGADPTAPIAGRLMSLWRYDGSPSGGAVPTTVATLDNTTTGGLKQTDPGGGRQKWLHSLWACSLIGGTLILYDRLLHIGSLDGTVTTAQTVGGSLTRYTDGVGNFAFAEIYTTVGASSTTIKLSSYTDQDGNTGQVGSLVTFGNTGFREDTRAIMLPLASGDTGVRAVASVQVTATTGTAGNFGVTIGHPLAYVSMPAPGVPGGRTFAQGLPGLPEIKTDACLAWLFKPAASTRPELVGGLSMLEG